MITLLTGQPGNGKTAYVVWHIIREAIAQGRIVYTVGIPKLDLAVIPITRAQLAKWHECIPKINPDDEDEIPKLKNFDEGALFVVDEAQKSWKPSGTNTSPDIEFLSEHRHHGLDFVVLTQFPRLVHATIRVLVTKHFHIRNTWRGRSLYEYPDWQENPHTKSVMQDAVKTKYVIPKEVYKLYESASIHTKLTHKTPIYFYFIVCVFIVLPFLVGLSVYRIYEKTQKPKQQQKIVQSSKPNQNQELKPIENNALQNQVLDLKQNQELSLQVVSTQYDWSKVGACVVFKNKCKCYGDRAESLVIPDSVCRVAVTDSWGGRSKTANPSPDPKPSDLAKKASVADSSSVSPYIDSSLPNKI